MENSYLLFRHLWKLTLVGLLAVGFSMGCTTNSAANRDTANMQREKEIIAALQADGGAVYPVGVPNDSLARYFTGRSFVYPMQKSVVNVTNVTFEPGCINYWHRHHGSCQVLAGVSGKGYYQIWGEAPKELLPGQSVTIPENVKHWHGAQHEHWFQHLSIMKEGASTEWLEPVNPSEYAKLRQGRAHGK